MDNLSVHYATKSCIKLGLSTITELLASKGIEVIFLPSYTPELNPIEKMNNIIKQHARKKQAGNKEKLDSAIEEKINNKYERKNFWRMIERKSWNWRGIKEIWI